MAVIIIAAPYAVFGGSWLDQVHEGFVTSAFGAFG